MDGGNHIQQQLDQAIRCNARSELIAAEGLCRSILATRPGHTIATHLLAVVLCRQGRLAEGEALLRALRALRPDDAEIARHLVDALHEQGKLAEAVAAACDLVALVPNDAEARLALGVSLDADGQLEAALEAYARALILRPDVPRGYFNLGHVLHRLGRVEEAVAAYSRALDHTPPDAELYLNLGNALADLERFGDALMAYDHALQLRPDWPEALSNAGVAAQAVGQTEGAATLHRRALETDPEFCPAWTNLGGALQRLDRMDEALAAFRHAAELQPDDPLVLANLAQALDGAGRGDEGGATHRRAVAADPDCAVAHFNLSIHLLRRGEYAEGWREYGWRWRGGVKNLHPRGFAQPEWGGEDLGGRTLLLHAEQGFGDTIQFVRFARHAAERGGRVVLEVQPALARLLTGMAETVVAAGTPLPPFDLHLPLMSLPGVLDLPESAFAADVPYVAASPHDVESWSVLMGEAGPRIGLVWSGNPGHAGDRQRSIPAAVMLAALADAPGRLFSLNKAPRDADRLTLAAHGRVVDLAPHLADFAHTAAALAHMDLVVSVDTAVAHLAGAMGRPVWLLLPVKSDWRWQWGREDTTWYPSMRLFRQTVAGDWAEVLRRVAGALA